MPGRIPPFDPGDLPPGARAVHDRILAGRGYLPGPYRFWLASPGFADRIEPLEDFLRHGVALDERQVEVVVLAVAKHWRSAYVWSSHAPAAARAGVEADAIEAIRRGASPAFGRREDETCHALARALLESRRVDDALWGQAHETIGEQRINEVLGLLGLYTSVCLTMVAYEMPAKDGESESGSSLDT